MNLIMTAISSSAPCNRNTFYIGPWRAMPPQSGEPDRLFRRACAECSTPAGSQSFSRRSPLGDGGQAAPEYALVARLLQREARSQRASCGLFDRRP